MKCDITYILLLLYYDNESLYRHDLQPSMLLDKCISKIIGNSTNFFQKWLIINLLFIRDNIGVWLSTNDMEWIWQNPEGNHNIQMKQKQKQ